MLLTFISSLYVFAEPTTHERCRVRFAIGIKKFLRSDMATTMCLGNLLLGGASKSDTLFLLYSRRPNHNGIVHIIVGISSADKDSATHSAFSFSTIR
jgi:hypothetical protein